MTAVQGTAWTDGPLLKYISVHTGLEVLMAVGNNNNNVIHFRLIALRIWERVRAPENRYAGFLIFRDRERPEIKRTLGRPRHRRKNMKRDV
jgi:hypothetical protein